MLQCSIFHYGNPQIRDLFLFLLHKKLVFFPLPRSSANFEHDRIEVYLFLYHFRSFKHLYLLFFQVLDVSGVPPWGFINGNNFWLGGKSDCNYLSNNYTLSLSQKIQKNNSLYRNSNEEHPPYELHFFAARMRHNSTVQYHIELAKEVSTRNLHLIKFVSIEKFKM